MPIINCVDLSVLSPTYLSSIPKDPNGNSYLVGINSNNNTVSLWAQEAEQREVAINFFDQDALYYISAVEAADGQSLEPKVKIAITNFIIECKSDGIWSSIKSSSILAGARTIDGALVPLIGIAPTQQGWGNGWIYNRKTGLHATNESNSYVFINRLNSSDPQNNNHNALYVSSHSSGVVFGAFHINFPRNTISAAATRNRTVSPYLNNAVICFIGHSRNNSDVFEYINNQTSTTVNSVYETPPETNFLLFRDGPTDGGAMNKSTVSFYSVGESLDLTKLDSRATKLVMDFDNSIQ